MKENIGLVKSFNSLQTGKPFWTKLQRRDHIPRISCFNSLQTGKSFRTGVSGEHAELYPVSIPFKRESPFGLNTGEQRENVTFVFQFPSNGKAFSD